jgi:hypothetical protein
MERGPQPAASWDKKLRKRPGSLSPRAVSPLLEPRGGAPRARRSKAADVDDQVPKISGRPERPVLVAGAAATVTGTKRSGRPELPVLVEGAATVTGAKRSGRLELPVLVEGAARGDRDVREEKRAPQAAGPRCGRGARRP